MKTLYKNCAILAGENFDYIQDGELVTVDDKITFVGSAAEKGSEQSVKNREGARVCDLAGALVMAGLFNTHGHLPMSLFRGAGGGLPLQSWLFDTIFPLESKLTPKSAALGSRLSLCEMIRSGTVGFADMYFFSDEIAEETIKSGLRANISRCSTSFDYEGDAAGLSSFAEQRELRKKYDGAGDGRINWSYSVHSVETCRESFIKSVADYAKRDGACFQIHLSETRKENLDCVARYGKTPARLFFDSGVFDMPTIAAHCVHLSAEDVALLAKKGVCVAHCPSSNMKLASGFAPIASYLKSGVSVTVGTDGAASNNNLDMLEELHIAALLSKAVASDATVLPAKEVLHIGTACGAKALGFANSGVLKVGAKADFIALKADSAHLIPMRSAVDNIVYSASGGDVCLTVVDGKVLFDGEFKTIDIERLKSELSGLEI